MTKNQETVLKIFLIFLQIFNNKVGAPHAAFCFGVCSTPLCAQKTGFYFPGLGSGILNFGNNVALNFLAGGRWNVEVYPVEHGGNPLFGWFFVSLKANTSEMGKVIAVQAESVAGTVNGAGEFVIQDGISASCKADVPGTSTGIGFGSLTAPPYATSMTMLHKLDLPPCATFSPTRELKYRAYILPSNNFNLWRPNSPNIFLKDYAYGAADPLPPKGAPLTCGPSTLLTNISWIDSVQANEPVTLTTGCLPEAGSSTTSELYYGGCNTGIVSRNESYRCDDISQYYFTLLKHEDYLQALKAVTCNVRCASEPVFWNKTEEVGYSVASEIGDEIWNLRKSHGIAMTIATMFLLPVGLFVTRYFKETFMSQKIAHLPVWYAVHIQFSLATTGMLFAGMVPQIFARAYFGTSVTLFGKLHIILGWVGIWFFLLALSISGFRSTGMRFRKLSICLHFLCGVIPYAVFLIAMLISAWIPGSPSGLYDSHIKFVFELFSVVVIIRIVVDLAFHCIMMCVNSRLGSPEYIPYSKRQFAGGIVPLPFSQLDSEDDVPGGAYRKRTLQAYVLTSLVFTFLMSPYIYFNSSVGRFFGPGSYTHKLEDGKLGTIHAIEAYDD